MPIFSILILITFNVLIMIDFYGLVRVLGVSTPNIIMLDRITSNFDGFSGDRASERRIN